MGKRCIYCKIEIADSSVVDFCDKCGISTFGIKMFRAIVDNMEKSRERGDLEQGHVH